MSGHKHIHTHTTTRVTLAALCAPRVKYDFSKKLSHDFRELTGSSS